MERDVCVRGPAGAFLGALARRRCADNQTPHSPAEVWGAAKRVTGADRGPESAARALDGGTTGVDAGWCRPPEVVHAGTGRAVSQVGPRRHSAVTGHEVGRGRSRRAVDCGLGVAPLHRGRSTVPGGAVARAVWASGWVRRAGWRTDAAHASQRRVALARHVVAAVRSRWRAPVTALLACSPCPRAP